MAWTKPPQGLIELFAASLPDAPGVTQRRMFGFPAAFVNGNMFAGLFQDQVFVRLPPDAGERLAAEHGALPFAPMPGRASKAYWVVPDDLMDDENAVADLLRQACRFAAALPPKEPKDKKRRAEKD